MTDDQTDSADAAIAREIASAVEDEPPFVLDEPDASVVEPPTDQQIEEVLAEVRGELADIHESNVERVNAAVAEGASIHPVALLKIRLDAVTEFLFANDDGMWLAFEHTFESALAAQLDDLEAEIRKAKLLDDGSTQMTLTDALAD